MRSLLTTLAITAPLMTNMQAAAQTPWSLPDCALIATAEEHLPVAKKQDDRFGYMVDWALHANPMGATLQQQVDSYVQRQNAQRGYLTEQYARNLRTLEIFARVSGYEDHLYIVKMREEQESIRTRLVPNPSQNITHFFGICLSDIRNASANGHPYTPRPLGYSNQEADGTFVLRPVTPAPHVP